MKIWKRKRNEIFYEKLRKTENDNKNMIKNKINTSTMAIGGKIYLRLCFREPCIFFL